MRRVKTFKSVVPFFVILVTSTQGFCGTLEKAYTIAPSVHNMTVPNDHSYEYVIECNASADSTQSGHSKTDSQSYTVTLKFHYIGSNTDTPPTSVKTSYADSVVGTYDCSLPGSPTHPYSVSTNYSCTVTTTGSTTISGNSGTIQQTTTDQSIQGPTTSTSMSATNQVVSTPLASWTSTAGENGIVDYYFVYKTWTISGNTAATVSSPYTQMPVMDLISHSNWYEKLTTYTVVLP